MLENELIKQIEDLEARIVELERLLLNQPSVPNTMLLDDNFLKRLLAFTGYVLLAQLVLGLIGSGVLGALFPY